MLSEDSLIKQHKLMQKCDFLAAFFLPYDSVCVCVASCRNTFFWGNERMLWLSELTVQPQQGETGNTWHNEDI